MLKKISRSKIKETPPAERMLMRRADRYLLENKRRSRRRKLLLLSMTTVSALVLMGTGVVYALLHAPILRVGALTVEGVSAVKPEVIENMVRAKYGGDSLWRKMLGPSNILAWQTGELPYLAASFPMIASASLERKGKNLIVKIEEREPAGVWCPSESASSAQTNDQPLVEVASTSASPSVSGGCFWFDSNGNAYKNALRPSGGLVLVVDGYPGQKEGKQRNVLDEKQMATVEAIWKVLKAVSIRPQSIRLGTPDLQEITVSLQSGPSLLFSSRYNPSYALPVIKQLQQEGLFASLQYIDFRVQNRAYYK